MSKIHTRIAHLPKYGLNIVIIHVGKKLGNPTSRQEDKNKMNFDLSVKITSRQNNIVNGRTCGHFISQDSCTPS